MTASEDLTAAKISFLGSMTDYICLSLLLYDYLITFDQEVHLVFTKIWTGTTVLFITYRYSALVAVAIACMPATPQNCRPAETLLLCMTICQYSIIAAFCSLRVHALGGRIPWLSVLVLFLGLVPSATNLVALIYDKMIEEDSYCYATSSLPFRISARLSIATRTALILSDVLILMVTLRSTWSTYMYARRMHVKIPLTVLVIREGALHFVVLLAAHISFMLNNTMKGPLIVKLVIEMITGILYDAGIPILLSHFILNLRQVAYQELDTNTSRAPPVSTLGIRFMASIVGNLGEPLDLGFEGVTDDNAPFKRSEMLSQDAESGNSSDHARV